MANEKKDLKKLTEENKQSVAGGAVYFGKNMNGEREFYVPHPNSRTRKSMKYSNVSDAKREARRLGLSDTVIRCNTSAEAKRLSDEELGNLIRADEQNVAITDFF